MTAREPGYAAPGPLRASLESGARCLVVSPHLDDAVLSCGAMLHRLARRSALTVMTVFSDAARAPWTRAARSIVRASGHRDAVSLYRVRRAEDHAALAWLGARVEHLGLPDAPFRRRDTPRSLTWVERLAPELSHRYPTIRFDLARGWVSRGDRTLRAELEEIISARAGSADYVMLPLGIGGHADHVLVRDVGPALECPVVYYSDFPYNLTHRPDPEFLSRSRLRAWSYDEGHQEKTSMIREYRSQLEGLFPSGAIPRLPEMYWVPDGSTA